MIIIALTLKSWARASMQTVTAERPPLNKNSSNDKPLSTLKSWARANMQPEAAAWPSYSTNQ